MQPRDGARGQTRWRTSNKKFWKILKNSENRKFLFLFNKIFLCSFMVHNIMMRFYIVV